MPLPYPIETPSQTAGPFLHIGLMPDIAGHERHPAPYGREIVGADTPGPRIEITGRVLDGTGTPVRDMLVEVWQADGAGIYNHPEDPRVADVAAGFSGFGRYATDFDDGSFRIETIKRSTMASGLSSIRCRPHARPTRGSSARPCPPTCPRRSGARSGSADRPKAFP